MNYDYTDLLAVKDNDLELARFVYSAISNFKTTDLYKTAKIADDYDRGENTTIRNYQRTITTLSGSVVPDRYRATHRGTSNFYHIFTSQLVQYLLANGITWQKPETETRLGADFSNKLVRLAKYALDGSVAFGYYNYDHLEVFPVYSRIMPCFCPIYDTETGALAAGIRFWQYNEKSPLRATLFTGDGVTDFMYILGGEIIDGELWTRLDDMTFIKGRKPYQRLNIKIPATGEEISDGTNYSMLPIFPLYGNYQHISEIVPLQEKIDAYDFILNGFADDLDNAQLYWVIRGAGGMDDPDLTRFLERLRLVGAVAPEDGQDVQAISVNIPVEAREKLLDRLETQLYKDAQAFNPNDVKSGSTVTAQIDAAYEPINLKANELEYCVLDFVYQLLNMLGIDDEPTFTRDKLSNTTEQISTLIQAGNYLSAQYITEKVLLLLGDGDKAEEVMQQMDAENMERFEQMQMMQAITEGGETVE